MTQVVPRGLSSAAAVLATCELRLSSWWRVTYTPGGGWGETATVPWSTEVTSIFLFCFCFVFKLNIIHFILPFGKFGPPYLGMAAAAARAALPSPTSGCGSFHVSVTHRGLGTLTASQHIFDWKTLTNLFCAPHRAGFKPDDTSLVFFALCHPCSGVPRMQKLRAPSGESPGLSKVPIF